MCSYEITKRFEGAERSIKYSYKVRNWISFSEGDAVGGFLSKLWALFGPPDEIGYEGFNYYIKDNKTGFTFRAYCGRSGPAFGGIENAQLDEALNDFEALLKKTIPADCEIEFPTDYGVYRTGAHNGMPFGKTIIEEKSTD